MIVRNDESEIAVIEHGRSSQGRRVILAGGTGAADGRKCACAWVGRGSRRGPRPPYSSPGWCRPASFTTRFPHRCVSDGQVRPEYGGDGDVRRCGLAGAGLAVAFLGQKFRPPTIRSPTGLWGAFGGLMIRAGAPENAVFGPGEAGMTLSDRHTHNLAV
jgi:hypothetical protein